MPQQDTVGDDDQGVGQCVRGRCRHVDGLLFTHTVDGHKEFAPRVVGQKSGMAAPPPAPFVPIKRTDLTKAHQQVLVTWNAKEDSVAQFSSWMQMDLDSEAKFAEFITNSAEMLEFCDEGKLTPNNLVVTQKPPEIDWITWAFNCITDPLFCNYVMQAWQAYLFTVPRTLLKAKLDCDLPLQQLREKLVENLTKPCHKVSTEMEKDRQREHLSEVSTATNPPKCSGPACSAW